MTNNEIEDSIEAIVEIPAGSMYKYELKNGKLVVDRPLKTSIPYNYGYIPNTLHQDGDPLDVCIIGNELLATSLVKIQLLGAFICTDNGVSDDKLVAVVVGDETVYQYLDDYKNEVNTYLCNYKDGFIVDEFVGPDKAYEIILKDRILFETKIEEVLC